MMDGPDDRPAPPMVYIVDDDATIRTSLSSLLRSVKLRAQAFSSLSDFLDATMEDVPSCLLLDVRLRGESGLVFQGSVEDRPDIPIVIMTGYADVEMCRQAMKNGAIDFLAKPCSDHDVIDAVHAALETDAQRRATRRVTAALEFAYERLSVREREVLGLVVGGALNKQIADRLGISLITVKVHRASVMRKMQASSLVDLVRMAEHMGIETSPLLPGV
ncbi:Nodulation protein W [Pararobbsia alpina]|uniref:response regulator transcription factor n=1 Tax=Pararobbsia alpina TaxID=621374 RepID=UPI0039A4AA9C